MVAGEVPVSPRSRGMLPGNRVALRVSGGPGRAIRCRGPAGRGRGGPGEAAGRRCGRGHHRPGSGPTGGRPCAQDRTV